VKTSTQSHTGRVALVTGAAQGIGQAIADDFSFITGQAVVADGGQYRIG